MNEDTHSEAALSLAETFSRMAATVGPCQVLPERVEVTVIGAGPVGLTAAIFLAQLGVDVALLEKNRVTTELPRAIAVDDGYMRFLNRLQLGKRLVGHASEPFGVHFISPFGFRLVEVPGFVTANGYGNRNAVLQPVFEKLLLEHLCEHGFTKICFRAEVIAIDQNDDEVVLEYIVDDARRQIASRYVLACDGARSFVRTALEIPFDGKRIDEPHLVIDLANFPDQVKHSRFFCNPRRPVNSVLAPYGGRRLEFMLFSTDDHQAVLTDQGIRALVDQHTPYKGWPLEILRRAIYGFSERIARRLNERRIFLLGDAAHVMPPFGGQGMNTGARDAANIGWKIAGVLQGKFNEDILATYDGERRDDIVEIVRYSVWVGRIANLRSWILAYVRDLILGALNLVPAVRRYLDGMRYMPRPQIRSGMVFRPPASDKVVGRLIPLLKLRDQNGVIYTIDDICGLSFALIGVDIPSEELAENASGPLWKKVSPTPLTILSDRTLLPLSPGSLSFSPADCFTQEFLRSRAGKIIGVRPDGYIAFIVLKAEFSRASDMLARFVDTNGKG